MEDQLNQVCILMATYNGAKFVKAQLDSLIGQSYSNWRLFIRDDGSSDDTLDIIKQYAAGDQRITLVVDSLGNLGSCRNFGVLLNKTVHDFEYFMFCDQDDFWLADKIQRTFNQVKALERSLTHGHPVLVHTRFQYVDNGLSIIESKRNFEALKIRDLQFRHLLAQNPVYGCTMMFNKTLADLVGTIPAEAENHDYWVALVASAFGKIHYINVPTILYRQHDNNISTNHDNSTFQKRIRRNLVERKIFHDVRNKIIIARTFHKQYGALLSQAKALVLADFMRLGESSGIQWIFQNIRHGIRRQTIAETVIFYLGVIFIKKPVNFAK